MPICPKCRQEYDEGFSDCADCLVPLVAGDAEDDAARDAMNPGAMQAAAFRAESAEVLDLMNRAVALHQLPAQPSDTLPGSEEKGHFLLVPLELGDRVVRILEQGLTMLIGEGEGSKRIYRMYQPDRDREIRDPELLKQSTSDLVAQGDAIIEELIEIVARGDASARRRAAYVLSCTGESGVTALTKLLKIAVERAEYDTAVSLIRVMRQELEPGRYWEDLGEYLTAEPKVKILALQAISALASLDAFDRVLPLLNDVDPEVRDEADNTLCTLADEDMGFETDAPESERRAAIERWEAWWAGRRNG